MEMMSHGGQSPDAGLMAGTTGHALRGDPGLWAAGFETAADVWIGPLACAIGGSGVWPSFVGTRIEAQPALSRRERGYLLMAMVQADLQEKMGCEEIEARIRAWHTAFL
jgi:hypothetical protein